MESANKINTMAASAVSEDEFKKVANKVSFITIVQNVLLSVFKLFAGIFAHSNAMISDAVHSASDVFSTIIVIIGVKLASKKSDKEHPYGHERLECVAAIVLSIVLLYTGIKIGSQAVKDIIGGNYQSLQKPGMLALVAAVVSIVTKEIMYWYTRHYAKKIDSSALMADAWHHRSDALSSVGALVGIGGAMMGFPVMDSVASIVIFFFKQKTAYEISLGLVVHLAVGGHQIILLDETVSLTGNAHDNTVVAHLGDNTFNNLTGAELDHRFLEHRGKVFALGNLILFHVVHAGTTSSSISIRLGRR